MGIKTLIAGLLTLVAVESSAQSLEFKTDFVNKYVLRGYALSNQAVAQPSLSAVYKDITAVGFANYDAETKKINEADAFIDYTTNAGDDVKVSAGVNLLSFPNTELDNVTEVYGAVSLAAPLNPKLMLLKSYGGVEGTIAELTLSQDVDVNGQNVNISGVLGYDNNYFNQGSSALSHLEMKVSSPIKLSDNITMTPMLNYSVGLTSGFNNELYGGVGISVKL